MRLLFVAFAGAHCVCRPDRRRRGVNANRTFSEHGHSSELVLCAVYVSADNGSSISTYVIHLCSRIDCAPLAVSRTADCNRG